MVHCGLYTPQNVNGEPCAGSHHQQGNTMLLQWGITPHTYRLMALCPGLPGWAGTRKVKPIWILLKQGSGISWAICKSAPRFRQITTPIPHRSVFYRPDALPAAQPTVSTKITGFISLLNWTTEIQQQWNASLTKHIERAIFNFLSSFNVTQYTSTHIILHH